MAIINIKFLEEKKACSEGLTWFKKNINRDIDARELIDILIKTDDKEKIMWSSWLLARILNRKCCIIYAIYSAELAREYARKEHLDVIDKAINAAKKCLENDTYENRKLANFAAYAVYAADDAAYAAAYAAASAASSASAAYAAATSAASSYAASASYTDSSAAAHKKTVIEIINYGLTLLEE